jgi:hypothetical protein
MVRLANAFRVRDDVSLLPRLEPHWATSRAARKGLAADVRNRYIQRSPKGPAQKERRMATRQIKMPVKDNSEQEVEEVFSQRDICSKSTGKRRVPTRPPKPLRRRLWSSKSIIRLCRYRFTTASITRTRWSRRRPPNHDEVPQLPWVTLEPLALSPRDADPYLSISEPSLSRLISAKKIEAARTARARSSMWLRSPRRSALQDPDREP